MRDRLVELHKQAKLNCQGTKCEECVGYGHGLFCFSNMVADTILADGWVRLPCKVGDNCYPLPRYKTPIVERKISRITFSQRNIIIGYYENDGQYRLPLRTRTLGVDVFLTREEAERALKGEKE